MRARTGAYLFTPHRGCSMFGLQVQLDLLVVNEMNISDFWWTFINQFISQRWNFIFLNYEWSWQNVLGQHYSSIVDFAHDVWALLAVRFLVRTVNIGDLIFGCVRLCYLFEYYLQIQSGFDVFAHFTLMLCLILYAKKLKRKLNISRNTN